MSGCYNSDSDMLTRIIKLEEILSNVNHRVEHRVEHCYSGIEKLFDRVEKLEELFKKKM